MKVLSLVPSTSKAGCCHYSTQRFDSSISLQKAACVLFRQSAPKPSWSSHAAPPEYFFVQMWQPGVSTSQGCLSSSSSTLQENLQSQSSHLLTYLAASSQHALHSNAHIAQCHHHCKLTSFWSKLLPLLFPVSPFGTLPCILFWDAAGGKADVMPSPCSV